MKETRSDGLFVIDARLQEIMQLSPLNAQKKKRSSEEFLSPEFQRAAWMKRGAWEEEHRVGLGFRVCIA